MGELWFAMSDVPDILCHVYRAEAFAGEPVETEEAVPLWASLNEIPYDRMWVDDVMWLPLLIDGVGFRGRFVFEEEAMRSRALLAALTLLLSACNAQMGETQNTSAGDYADVLANADAELRPGRTAWRGGGTAHQLRLTVREPSFGDRSPARA